MKNFYYDNDSFGLSKVDELDEGGLSYEYNTLVVFKHDESGRVFYATDAGCSCPTPFENFSFNGPDATDLTEITAGDSFDSFRREVEGFPASQQEREDCIATVQKLLRGRA